jgi:ubiquinone/menaquinone biosynthesis C-methylase UbiE
MRHLEAGYRELIARVREAVPAGADVADLAAGTGLVALAIADRVRTVIALDLSARMIGLAQAKAVERGITNVRFVVGDAAGTGLASASVDAALACNVLHVMQDPAGLIREMRRVVKPRGLIVVASYCHGQSLVTRTLSGLMSLRGFAAHHKWSVGGLSSFLADNGLEVTSRVVSPGPIPMLYAEARDGFFGARPEGGRS